MCFDILEMNCSDYITYFFESKGLTVEWIPETAFQSIFTTKIKDVSGKLISLEKTINSLYEHYKDYYIHANHIQLMYYKSQYLSAFPLFLGTKYDHDKDITKFFIDKGLTVNWFPNFLPNKKWIPGRIDSTDKMINRIWKYYKTGDSCIDLMYYIGRDGTPYLWARFLE